MPSRAGNAVTSSARDTSCCRASRGSARPVQVAWPGGLRNWRLNRP
jgi:hypothetical protein